MKFQDTEGGVLPFEDPNDWDLNLWGNACENEKCNFVLITSIPWCIDLGETYYDTKGEHVIKVSLRDVLQEYLEKHEEWEGKDNLLDLANLLREFADKYEAATSIHEERLTDEICQEDNNGK